MNIIKRTYRLIKGLNARRKLNKSDVLPDNSRKLYKDMKKAGLK